MSTVDVSDLLGSIASVLRARGNGDHPSSTNKCRPGVPEDPGVTEVHIVRVEEILVGFIHAFPLPEEVPRRTLGEMLDLRFVGPVDVMVCGDTH
jgi:hypothetical protein